MTEYHPLVVDDIAALRTNGGPPMKWAEVDVSAIHANVSAIHEQVGSKTALMAMVKANGYGHGAIAVSRAAIAAGATWLGVSSPEEAYALRASDITMPILNVGWTHPDHVQSMIAHGVDMMVTDIQAIDWIAAVVRHHHTAKARIHVKVDTGMNRLGVLEAERDVVLDHLQQHRNELTVVGMFTHFADADGADPTFTLMQIDRFNHVVQPMREVFPDALLHSANSAAALRFPQARFDLVRPGIAMYGYQPHAVPPINLLPAMTMCSLVSRVKTIPKGAVVGYGRTWTAEKSTRVATVTAGYADGVHRLQSNRGVVMIHGVRCPIVGRISMDQLSCDVSTVDTVVPGDEVMLFGKKNATYLGADEVATFANTVSYEVLCAVAPRVPRVVYGHNAAELRAKSN